MFCKDNLRWLYSLDADYSWDSGIPIKERMEFCDKRGRVWLIISKEGVLTVKKGYCWDGCSPKFCFLDIVVGTPDGAVYSEKGEHYGLPKSYHASLIHDACCQFLDKGLPYSRKTADYFLLTLMRDTGFELRWIYYISVRLFARLIRVIHHKKHYSQQ